MAALDLHVDVLKNRLVLLVTEGDILHLDGAVDGVQGNCIFLLRDLRNRIDNLEHTLCAVHAVREPPEEERHEVHRSGQLSDIAREGNQNRVVEPLLDENQVRAEDVNHQRRQVLRCRVERRELVVVVHNRKVCVANLLVALVKPLDLAALLAERLDDACAA